MNNTLSKPVHEAIRQRITVHYDFRGLSAEEIPDYVKHKLRVAGGADSIIDHAAMASVHSLSQGNPRIIDTLMTDALALGAQMDKKIIDAHSGIMIFRRALYFLSRVAPRGIGVNNGILFYSRSFCT